MPRTVAILGSTGSIGTQALDVISRSGDRFEVLALTASGRDLDLLARQAVRFAPRVVAVADPAGEDAWPGALARARAEGVCGPGPVGDPEMLWGAESSERAAALGADVVLNGLAGAAGLLPTLAALRAGSVLALANKESLIIGGPLVKAAAAPGQIVPVDSEHSALAQCLRAGSASEVRRLILTASGGPFRGRSRAALASVTPDEALAHPTWSMGPLVTVNSATLVNKGLEVIEAHLLFDLPFEQIDVVVHPQSIVHSMVEFVDGSTIAQASPPDMRLPIALGLAWPDRVPGAAPTCDWSKAATWEFEPLDEDAFPAVRIARMAGSAGGTAPAVFNGADEACVAAFLERGLPFTRIVDTIEKVLQEHLESTDFRPGNKTGLSDVIHADTWARQRARELTEGG